MIILGTNSIKDTGYEVANSCRFNDGDTAYMHKTPSSDGNNQKYTLSIWLKRSALGTKQIWTATYGNLGRYSYWGFDSTDVLVLNSGNYSTGGSTTTSYYLKSKMKFRDISSYYHIVFAVDTTQGSASNRAKLYVNGTQVDFNTADADYELPGLNEQSFFNKTTTAMQLGVFNSSNDPFDGYMAEVCWIDSTQYAASDFGEFDEDSPTIWKPKDVSGLTFGTNGFYLDFEDSSNLGNDANGGTDLTEVNLAATDQATDTPTNNFCTFNSLYNFNVDPTYSEGNCLLTFGSTWGGGKATMAVDKGKWYWEAKLSGTMTNHFHGIQEVNVSGNLTAANPMNLDGSVMFFNQDGGEMRKDDTDTTNDYGTFSDGDIIGIALNMDGGSYGQITIYKNGSAIVSDYDLSSNNDLVAPFTAGGGTMSYNFGGSPSFTISSGNADGNGYGNFEYSVPSGYYSLCTKNLAEFG